MVVLFLGVSTGHHAPMDTESLWKSRTVNEEMSHGTYLRLTVRDAARSLISPSPFSCKDEVSPGIPSWVISASGTSLERLIPHHGPQDKTPDEIGPIMRLGYLLLFIGTGFVAVVVLTHIAEALHIFPWMGWGIPNSPGHYLDLVSAIAGPILLTVGYLSRIYARRRI
jgi:hypothetical protein